MMTSGSTDLAARSRRRPLHRIALAVTLTALAASAVWLFPGPLPTPRNPDYVDNIFDSRAIVWIARLLLASAAAVLVVGGVFVVASAAVHMRRGHWLRRAGPFEVSEHELGDAAGCKETSNDSVHDEYDELVDLRVRLAITSELLDRIQRERA